MISAVVEPAQTRKHVFANGRVDAWCFVWMHMAAKESNDIHMSTDTHDQIILVKLNMQTSDAVHPRRQTNKATQTV